MKKNISLFGLLLLLGLMLVFRATAQDGHDAPVFKPEDAPRLQWSWTGLFGHYDKAAAQRGLQVYTQACASCHSLKLLAFRDLAGIGYSEEQIKGFARTYQITAVGDDGKVITRAGLPSDYFPSPFATEADARLANGGALPPDMSLIIKARDVGRHNVFVNFADMLMVQGGASGADYVAALLTGYSDTLPEGMTLGTGMSFSKYFHGGQIAMPQMLTDGAISYGDGTANDAHQLAHDVVTFLMFVSEPHLEASRYAAIKFFIMLALIYFLVYRMKKNVWRKLDK